MNRSAFSIRHIAAIALLVLLCALAPGIAAGTSKVYVRNGDEPKVKIAVLPFENVSRDQEAARRMTITVFTYLLATKMFDVVDQGVVNSAMTAEGIRSSEALSPENYQKLQARLKVDAVMIGLVEDYGEVRIGSESYPSISFSARLVNARTAEILWAATISKTGNEGVKIFDIGRVASLGKLSKMAVEEIAHSLVKARKDILKALSLSPVSPLKTTPAPATGTDATNPPAPTTQPGPTAAKTARYQDEEAAYGEKELTALLGEVGGMKPGTVEYAKHHHDTVETRYGLAGGQFIEVKLVDYRQISVAKRFLITYQMGKREITIDDLPAFAGVSEFPYYHLDVAVGRFGLFLRGPKDRQGEIDTLAKGIIGLLK
jgi:hypothetical protein